MNDPHADSANASGGPDNRDSFRTRAIHVGSELDPATGAVIPPLHLASTYRQPAAGKWGEFDYARSGNPTRTKLQETLASLEGGCGALAFSSGMSAIHCVTMLLRGGDHVVAGCDLYGGAYRLLHKICDRSGIDRCRTLARSRLPNRSCYSWFRGFL